MKNWLKRKLRTWLDVPEPNTSPEVIEMIERAEKALYFALQEAKNHIRTDQANELYSAMEANQKFDALADALGVVVVANTHGEAEICPADKQSLRRSALLLEAQTELQEMRKLRNMAIEAFERTGDALRRRVSWGSAEKAIAMAQAYAKAMEADRRAH